MEKCGGDHSTMATRGSYSAAVIDAEGRYGEAIADALARAGWRVSLFGSRVHDASARAPVHAGAGELERSAESVLQGFDDIRALIAVAGRAPAGGVLASEHSIVEQALLRNVADTIRLIRTAARRMAHTADGASIVIVLDGLYDGEDASRELSLAGSASAGALERTVQTLACELGPCGIRVNAVRAQTRAPHKPLPDVPLGRTATATDVAAVVAFLAGDEASYVTGAVVPVDGGAGAIR